MLKARSKTREIRFRSVALGNRTSRILGPRPLDEGNRPAGKRPSEGETRNWLCVRSVMIRKIRVPLRWCDEICVYLRYLRYLRFLRAMVR